MTLNPERNDIDISMLFDWGGKFSIYDRNGNEKITYYARLVGDAELNRARVFALRKSRELRKILHDSNSDDRQAFIIEYDELEFEKLVELTIAMSMREITTKVVKEINIPLPKEPRSDADLEQQERYQAEVDNWPNLREEKIKEAIEKEVERYRKTFSAETKERLYRLYEDAVINELCEIELSNSFKQMCTYFGSFKDENYQERLFLDFKSFDNLPTAIKNQFTENYTELELDTDELKK